MSQSRALGTGVVAGALLSAAGACGVMTIAAETDDRTWAPLGSMLLAASAHGVAALARAAARAASADAPLRAACPGCAGGFMLAAADATADAAAARRGGDANGRVGVGAGAGDEAWVREHTRPCPRPSCRAPILKNGGCNQVRCGRCRLEFCWACMQPMQRCKHFECANGAPFGNASLWDAADGDGMVGLEAAGHRAAHLAACTSYVADALALAALIRLAFQAVGRRDLANWVAQSADSALTWPAELLVEAVLSAHQAAFTLLMVFCTLFRWLFLALAVTLILLAMAELARANHPAGQGVRLQQFIEGLVTEWMRTAERAVRQMRSRRGQAR